MPTISQVKRDKIQEQILHHLFTISPAAHFTAAIAKEIARDEEFIKKLLLELKEKNLVLAIRKGKNGEVFSRRMKWKLTNNVYNIYHSKQHNTNL